MGTNHYPCLAGWNYYVYCRYDVYSGFFGTIIRRRHAEGILVLPESEAFHDEQRVPLFDRFKPWLVAMAAIIIIAYVPAIMDANKTTGPKAPRFAPENPVPEKIDNNEISVK